ncbi:MAG: phage integrase family protein [Actinomycetia bacterium]|nr:phage integrase family protein [Actinomycetes bacterium]
MDWTPASAVEPPGDWMPSGPRPELVDLDAGGCRDLAWLLDCWAAALADPATGVGASTANAYSVGLRRFAAVCVSPGETVTWPALRLVLCEPRRLRAATAAVAHHWAAATASSTMAATRSFAAAAHEAGALPSAPTMRPLRRRDVDSAPGWSLDAGQVTALLDAAGAPLDDPVASLGPRIRHPARDRAIFGILVASGLRANELLSMTGSWIRGAAEDTVLEVVGKGGRRRSLPVGANAALVGHLDTLREVFEQRRGRPAGRDDRLVGMTYAQLRRLLFAVVGNANLLAAAHGTALLPDVAGDVHGALHGLRRTAAQLMLERRVHGERVVGLPELQAALGWRNIATANAYLKQTSSGARNALGAVDV